MLHLYSKKHYLINLHKIKLYYKLILLMILLLVLILIKSIIMSIKLSLLMLFHISLNNLINYMNI